MSRLQKIVVTADPKGMWMEGPITTAEKPGTICQINPSVALVGGRHTFVVYNRDADGDRPAGALWVLIENYLLGRPMTEAYEAGDRGFFYSPRAGEELNLLYKNVTGTADDVAVGSLMTVDDGTGKLIVTTGSPEIEVAVALEAITDPTEDQLLWCQWTGH